METDRTEGNGGEAQADALRNDDTVHADDSGSRDAARSLDEADAKRVASEWRSGEHLALVLSQAPAAEVDEEAQIQQRGARIEDVGKSQSCMVSKCCVGS